MSQRGGIGASALDPRVLAALWIWATLQGIGSARAIARLCEEHVAYRWLCGDEPVNHHSLSDFLASDPAWIAGLLVQSAAARMHAGVANLERVAQDGMRVRASAGAGSFRRKPTLAKCRAEAQQQVAALKAQRDDASPTRSSAAQERAARERVERLDQALAAMAELQAANAEQSPSRRKEAEALRPSDSDELASWRTRLGTPEAQAEYRHRASTAEWVNAQARNRGLQQFRMRGLAQVLSVSLGFGSTHNFTRGVEWKPLISR